MGFSKVYKALQEIFPEVDSRILRAVAIEHRKDADAAVEVVLSEVIPCLVERNKPPSTSSGKSGVSQLSEAAAVDANEAPQTDAAILDHAKESFHEASCGHHQTVEDTDGESLQHYHVAVCGDHVVLEGDEIGTPVSKNGDKASADKSCQVTALMSNPEDRARDDDLEKCGHSLVNNEECGHSLVNNEKCGHSASPEETSFKVEKNNGPEVAFDQLCQPTKSVDSHNTLEGTDNSHCDDSAALVHKSVLEEVSLVDNQDMKLPESQLASPNVQTSTLSGSESSIEFVIIPDVHNSEPEKAEIDAASNKDLAGEMVVNEAEWMPDPVVTASGQIWSIDLLEDMMTEAKNNKKTLFSAMESVICLMREVELQEEAAEQAKQEAAKGGVDILRRVEELKEMLRHAKEANNMVAFGFCYMVSL